MQSTALTGGFAKAPQDAARAFRAVMNVMARPGLIETLTGAKPPAPLSDAAGTLALTLLDGSTPVHLAGALDCKDVRDWITFHTGAPFTGREHCAFAFGLWSDLLPLAGYPIGNPEYPDRGATLVVEMPALTASGVTLSGPGIKDAAALNLPDRAAFRANAMQFPLGLDFFFTSENRIAALPRSTKVEAA
ncbi:Alpha-D-ribose 1-methylphosphonate 5-triphosphate synthase subunit PhnH [Thalassovita gelatinovora]|uniref:Alpha-D-ribose 1-methylphosphonate 5-triphosphate synthase subunit PhnH n=1 Tax=Thalassovita gelatinovora TaxID=53501 RepID=A0A0N7LUY5_THAGE|nr:phosphonate C-P lyase system protein PhnH [Thalassovita gelatinovora]QIZ81160.1 phosphonate C-P lyase system protein PhnH [Thalassovita gelatinovora]CUH64794.1 Alpha-D-ribose 1-methylphosphonate 5-triphosphate synthase subunit PhnH [Thalassovita gelatinovora]SEP91922.1 alpha-D-ribose 1-methylphosphonate 5-triphosphate synthase subunit PhnH [Thalassovita gelatinovora]